MIGWLSQRMIVIVDVHVDVLPLGFEVVIVLIALTWWNSQVILANHQISGRLDVLHMTHWALLKHPLQYIRCR